MHLQHLVPVQLLRLFEKPFQRQPVLIQKVLQRERPRLESKTIRFSVKGGPLTQSQHPSPMRWFRVLEAASLYLGTISVKNDFSFCR